MLERERETVIDCIDDLPILNVRFPLSFSIGEAEIRVDVTAWCKVCLCFPSECAKPLVDDLG